jgi:hypothetical protein
MAKYQAWWDVKTRESPAYFPAVDIAALIERGDVVFADKMADWGELWGAAGAACEAAAGAGPAPAPAAAAAGGAAAAAAEAASGARAPAAAAATVLLTILLV